MIVVLFSEGGGDFRVIGLLEPFWEVLEVLIDKRFNMIDFHDSSHGFLKGQGTGTAMMEAKIAQQLVHLEQDTMDREHCLIILERLLAHQMVLGPCRNGL